MTDRPAERPSGSQAATTAAQPGTERSGTSRLVGTMGAVGGKLQATVAKVKDEVAAGKENAARPARSGKPARKARLRLTRVDPWSVMKMAFLLAIALGVVTIVAVAVVWGVLGAAGVWDSINSAVVDIVGEEGSGWNIQDYLGTARVLGFTMVISVVNVVLITAGATLGAFLYNMAAALLGGVEVTLTEDN